LNAELAGIVGESSRFAAKSRTSGASCSPHCRAGTLSVRDAVAGAAEGIQRDVDAVGATHRLFVFDFVLVGRVDDAIVAITTAVIFA
jgi:hypothetical protein